MLFWPSGKSDNKLHPGDDDRANLISVQCVDLPIIPVRTNSVRKLMVGTSLCDQIVTGDSGALHIVAGVRKPVVALSGSEAAQLWTSRGVPYEMLQGRDYSARNTSVDDIFA